MSGNRQTTCPHCTQETLFYVTAASCHCINPACPADHVTLPEAEFMALTPELLKQYEAGRTHFKALEPGQDAFTAAVESIVKAASVREAARQSNERLFG